MESEFKLIVKNNIEIILPLLEELDPTISKTVLKTRLSEMVEMGYECMGVYCKDELIGICRTWTLVKYYIGKYIEPDNVYIKAKYRGLGIGVFQDSCAQKMNFYTQLVERWGSVLKGADF